MHTERIFIFLLLMAVAGCEKRDFIELASVRTGTVEEVLALSARLGGVVVDVGPGIEEHGICLAAHANPSINDLKFSLGSAPAPGNFTLLAGGLEPGTQYQFRAYALSKGRAVYGDPAGFRTLSGVPLISTTEPWGHSPEAIMAGGRITDDGGAPITARGLCWNTAGAPEAGKDETLTAGAPGSGVFELKVEGLQQNKAYHIRAWAANALGTWYGESRSFILKKPEVVTLDATDITPTGAKLNGTVNANGAATSVVFEWGETTSYGNTVTANPGNVTGSTVTSVSATLTGLTPGKTYHYRVKGSNGVGNTNGGNKKFTSGAPLAPTVITLDATEITPTGARLNGTVNANGAATNVVFEWGETTSYGNTVTATPGTVSGSTVTNVSATLTGLTPGKTYHFRVKGANSAGTENGGNKAFIPDHSYGSLTDIDGNTYKTIQIGSQTWMAENLRTTKYKDGTAIPLVTVNSTWAYLSTPAYCWYDNDKNKYAVPYGALYNWYTVNTGKLCPTGWHVPSDAEWTALTDFLGGESVAGGKMKEIGTTHWRSPNIGATNDSGFTGVPGGYRYYHLGTFYFMGLNGYWWSSSAYYAIDAWSRRLFYDSAHVSRYHANKRDGFSVRCLRD